MGITYWICVYKKESGPKTRYMTWREHLGGVGGEVNIIKIEWKKFSKEKKNDVILVTNSGMSQ